MGYPIYSEHITKDWQVILDQSEMTERIYSHPEFPN